MDTEQSTGDGIVQIAYLHPETVSHSWAESMRKAWLYDCDLAAQQEEGYGPGARLALSPLNMRCTSASIMTARNFATRLFLDRTPHEWLMFTDTDMGFEPDAIHRLLEAADPVERPVMGGLCFAQYEAEFDGMNGYGFTIQPTLYRIGTTSAGHARFCFYGDYPTDSVIRVAATGAAFLLIHRSVLESMRELHGNRWWTQAVDEDGDMVGEDMAFCARLLAMDIPVHVHTGVKTNHHKQIWLQEEDYLRQAIVEGSLVTVEPLPLDLPEQLKPVIDVGESLATLARNEHDHDGMLKLPADLARYAEIIEATKPDLIIETGTWNGGSARWFAEHAKGCQVITIDVNPEAALLARERATDDNLGVAAFTGSSIDPEIVEQVTRWAGKRQRVMVVLDSDHRAEHVAREIELYGPLVTPGCYLVVEDGLFDYAPNDLIAKHYPNGNAPRPGPTAAIAEMLMGNPSWSRDMAIERLSPTSHSPAGWWIKNG